MSIAVFGGWPVVFYTGQLFSSPNVEGPYVLVNESSPVVFTNGDRFWFVK